jgi:hypothetical protein
MLRKRRLPRFQVPGDGNLGCQAEIPGRGKCSDESGN